MIADVDKIFEEEPEDEGDNDQTRSRVDNNCYHRIHKHLKVEAQSAVHLGKQKFDTDRVIITLKQIVRDWAAEGEDERRACYDPILEAIMEHFQDA